MSGFSLEDLLVFGIEQDEINNMFWAILGGSIGGLLLKPLSLLQERLLVYRDLGWLSTIGLGAAAAGITAFVLGNTDGTDVPHLFFLSVLSGLAFPGILAAAINNVAKWTREAETMSELANQSSNPKRQTTVTNEAASVLTASKGIPEHGVRAQIDRNAMTIIENINAGARTSRITPDEAIEQVGKLGKAAKYGGFPSARFKAIDVLTDLLEQGADLTEQDRSAAEKMIEQI